MARLSLRPASLVRIEQQLTQGDENDGADDRRKEYGRKGKSRFQHAPNMLSPGVVCANRKFCWQRLPYGKAAARGWGPRQEWRRKQALSAFLFGLAALRDFPLGQDRPEGLSGLFHQQVSLRIRI